MSHSQVCMYMYADKVVVWTGPYSTLCAQCIVLQLHSNDLIKYHVKVHQIVLESYMHVHIHIHVI